MALEIRFWSYLLDILFPAVCISCNSPTFSGSGLCHDCWSQLEIYSPPWCGKCGKQTNSKIDYLSCNGCIHRNRAYDKLRTGINFEHSAKDLIHQLKYKDKTNFSKLLSALASRSARDFADADIIAPIPLHPRKMIIRKYNQSVLLAYEFSRILRVKPYMQLLLRIKETRSQVGLSSIMRRFNMRDAFEVNKEYLSLIKNKKVILVDDVISTGATAHEGAKCLKKAGASLVYVLCIARNELNLAP
jgi:ComF family protein